MADKMIRLSKDTGTLNQQILLVQGDSYTYTVLFAIQRYQGGVDLSTLTWGVNFKNAGGEKSYVPLTVIDSDDEMIYIEWSIGSAATRDAGNTYYTVEGTSAADGTKVWKSSLHCIIVAKAEKGTENIPDDELDNLLEMMTEERAAIAQEMEARLSDRVNGAFVENGYLYLTADGEVVVGPIGPFAGSGGGSGSGGNSQTYVPDMKNLLDSRSLTAAQGSPVNLIFNYTSVDEDGVDDGDGVCTISVGGAVKGTFTVSQGRNVVDISSYLVPGSNNILLVAENSEGYTRRLIYSVTIVELSMTTTFNEMGTYSGDVNFVYTVTGVGDKDLYFKLNGQTIVHEVVSASGKSRTLTIPEQAHGDYVLEAYAEMNVNGTIARSNTLKLGMIWVDSADITPLVLSTFSDENAVQGDTIYIPYMVYDPLYETAWVTLEIIGENGETYSTSTIQQDRTATSWAVQDYPAGTTTFRISCRGVQKDFVVEVEEYQFPLSVETDSLKLEFNAAGRSNNENNPASWSYTNEDEDTYTATFSGFGWTGADGWIYDESNVSVLRFLPGDMMTIPFKPFTRDARETGYTIEVELATRDVRDYESIVVSCLSGEINGAGGIGFRIRSQEATLRTQGIPEGISMLFKEDSRVRVAFVIEPRNSNRLIYIYINGVMCGAVQYGTNDNIQQATPVGLTIGAESCGIDLYKIRCYARGLDRNEQLDNYICDKDTLAERQEAYKTNNILNESTLEISVDKLPNTVPYMIVKCAEMPQFKGDKKTADIYFIDPTNSAKSFVALGCQIDVQGTSSAGYPVKNSKIKLKNLTINDVPADAYAIHDGEAEIATICTKVDYASSEGANNVILVRLYDMICREMGLLTPPQEEDTTIRQGISGRPIVMFWQNSNTNDVSFYGKANMNWDKGNPDAFGFTAVSAAESWEFKNNTSNHCLFKNGDMTGWENDFEARYPEDYTDITRLGRVLSWVASTDTTAATNTNLASAVTYEGTQYTKDTAAYRLAKFKAEFADWFYKDLAIFYYLFTQQFLMVDSRAKNMFITWYGETVNGHEKWVASLPYDMDTAIGINNEGELVFEYNLEDTDTVGGSNVFNGQNSVLWNNLREAFASDIASMYIRLRTTSRYFNYAYVKNMFEEHQSVWPERLWNEDAFTKYLYPFLSSGTDNLSMLQGSKESQRDWWLFNAFRYWDSKYETGDATTNVITLRTYASGDITLVPYSHIYARLRYGSYDVRQRAERNEAVTLACPFDPTESANDTETYLYSADRIGQIYDLSPLLVGYADFSRATKLQYLKLGDNADNYENTHLSFLSVGNNELLSSLNVQKCTALTQTIDLSGCTGIEEFYAGGSAIAGVTLPNGGHLQTLELPNTVTNLTVLNQTNLDAFTMTGYNYLQTLRVENTPNIPFETAINSASNLSYVRLVNVEWTATSETTLQTTINRLKNCMGQDATGANTDKAVVIGRVYVSSISSDLLADITENFPNLVVVVNNVPQYVVSFINYDNSVVYRIVVPQGGNAYDPVSAGYVSAPTKPTDVDGLRGYSFKEWSSLPTNVQSNISVTAVYTNRWRVRYLNYNADVLQSSLVVEGGTATYSGSTPTKPGDAQYSYTFSGWEGNQMNIQSPTDLTAVYTPTVRTYNVRFYNASTTMQQFLNLAYGSTVTYSGSTPTHPTDPANYGFGGWNTNDGVTYTAGMRVTRDLDFYAQWIDMNSVLTKYLRRTMTDYEGTTGSTIVTDAFYNRTELVTAKTSATTIQEYAFRNCSNLTTVEMTSTSAGTIAANAFNGLAKLNALIINSTSLTTLSATNALTGTAIAIGNGAIYVPAGLVAGYKAATNWSTYAAQIYSIDEYPVTDFSTIKDSWATIVNNINNGDAASLYKVGDTKLFEMTDGTKCYAQLASLGGDVLASDGTTTVATTWIIKGIYANHNMNSTNTTEGGYPATAMAAYLEDESTGVIAKLPDVIRNNIKSVQKTYYDYASASTLTSNHKLWIPSYREVMFGTDKENSGIQYSGLFGTSISTSNRTERIKYNSSGSANLWWLRSAISSTSFYVVSNNGSVTNTSASSSYGVVFGFCI